MQLLLLNNFSATIDIIALIILIIYALYGTIRGFTKTFFSVFGSIIGVAIAILIAPSVVTFLQNKYSLINTLSTNFYSAVNKMLGSDLASAPLSAATSDNLKGIAGFIINIVLSLKNNKNVSPDATIGQAVSSIFAYYVVLIVSVIALFIIFKIMFFIIGEIVKKAYKNKAIASFDRIFGFVLGIINGIFNINIIIMVIGILPIPILQEISIAINNTAFTKFIQNINIYQLIFNNLIHNNIINTLL